MSQDGKSGESGLMIREIPDRERPRERLIKHGAEGLKETELLAILLRSGRRGRSVLELAGDLLARFEGDLGRLALASVSELRSVKGIGAAKAVQVRAAFALAGRLSKTLDLERPQLEEPSDVAELLRETFRNVSQEQFRVLLLDTKHYLLKNELVTVGLLDRSHVHAREVFRRAIRESCSRVILVHNHPSGDPTPSGRDIACTRDLVSAGKIVGIEVLDHVIIGTRTPTRTRDYVSFRDEKLI